MKPSDFYNINNLMHMVSIKILSTMDCKDKCKICPFRKFNTRSKFCSDSIIDRMKNLSEFSKMYTGNTGDDWILAKQSNSEIEVPCVIKLDSGIECLILKKEFNRWYTGKEWSYYGVRIWK